MVNQKTPGIDIENIKNHWVATSNDDFQTMVELYSSKSYNWALFLGHIVSYSNFRVLNQINRINAKK